MNKLLKVSTLGLCLLSGLVTNIIAPNSAFAAEVESEPNKHYVPFQARLHDESGVELNGIYQLNFKLYDQETTGTTLWTETHENVSVVSGYVNVLLGGINDLKNEASSNNTTIVPIDFSKQRYLGISIGKYVKQGGVSSTVLSNELLPRHQLVPSFHAATATDSAKLGGYAAEHWSKKTEMLSAVKVVQDDLDYVRSSSFTPDTREVEQPDGSFVNETYYIAGKSTNADHALTADNADNADKLGNVAASSYLKSADLDNYATKLYVGNNYQKRMAKKNCPGVWKSTFFDGCIMPMDGLIVINNSILITRLDNRNFPTTIQNWRYDLFYDDDEDDYTLRKFNFITNEIIQFSEISSIHYYPL